MTKTFGPESTTDEVLDGIDLSGTRVLVTGVSAGLGVETARALAAHDAEVVGAARDLDKARRVTQAIGAAGKGSLALIELDLASLASVRAAADALVNAARPFDLVIANAGVMACPKGTTKDGFETQFGTNHLGHFVLVNRIASLLKSGSRLVNLSSAGHRYSDVNLDDPNFERAPYTEFGAYGRSKTAKLLFAVEFDRRHKSRGIRATAVHPGGIRTELGRYMTEEARQQLIQSINASRRRARPSSSGRRSRKVPQRRSGQASSSRPMRLAVATAKTALSPRSSMIPISAAACGLTPSIRNTPRRCGPKARRWSASDFDPKPNGERVHRHRNG